MEPTTEIALDRTLIAACNRNALAGLAAGIVKNGSVVYAKGFGMADAARGVAITPDTSFRIGSISKTLTAIALMQLHEQGRFQLDDPVNKFLRAYRIEQPRSSPPVTFRHLLTHTSGIGELRRLSDLLRPAIGLGCKPGRLPTLREYYGPALKTDVAPELKWAYANHGFATLGQLVEDISGHPFAEYMRAFVLGPLGMDHSDFVLSDSVRSTLAQGYRMRRKGLRPVPFLEIVPTPAGACFSSVNEMVKYIAGLLGGGANEHGRIIQAGTLAMMMTPQYQLDPRLAAQGLAFMLSRVDGIRVAGHNGGWSGFTSGMWLAPDDGAGVVVFTNTTTVPLDGLAFDLVRQALGKDSRPAAEPILEQPVIWGELCGTYRPVKGFNSNLRLWMLGGAARVFVSSGRLMIGGRIPFAGIRKGLRLDRADPADPLFYRAEFAGLEILVLFRRNASGRVDSMSAASSTGAFAALHKKS